MDEKAHRRSAIAAFVILIAVMAGVALLVIRPIRLDSPASPAARALKSLDRSFGATLEPLDAATARRLGHKGPLGAMVVTSIAGGGPAEAAGMRVGDVVEQIGSSRASNVRRASAAALARRPVPIIINRRGKHAILEIAAAGPR
jgi:S1-C subfamily serine protease